MWVDPFSIRLAAPLSTAAGTISERRGFLVGVEGDGSRGLGEATPLPGWTESYEAARQALADATLYSPPDPDATPAAAHGVDLARLDAAARREGRPLAAGLREQRFDSDRPLPESVPVNATIGDGSVRETVDAATAAVDDGFDWLKLKVGLREPDVDFERVRAVRTAVDDGVSIRLDANGAWDRPTAKRMVDRLAPVGIDYLEQPLPAADLADHGTLRGHGVDIAVDESLAETSVEAVIDAGAADVVVIKPMAVGGPTRAVAAAGAARAAGVEPVVTTTIDAVVARTAAVHVAAAIPDVTACGLSTGSLLDDDLAADPVAIADGRARLPTGAGLCGDGFDSVWPAPGE
ncbi:mandelate racemase/muconate lactonizing enzyme family protein [Halohasta salina]|uniref:mandelate racemase/muconate lactonizing enzyme family protein n=1 Tax=Halohasta salina TaxID=2961621 RepID=UPI0020A424B6|nr:o-succinylbenzoate synthase [Halohasta salina]